MKMNIQITQIENEFLRENHEIANIDICNGNWKYIDDRMEETEKISLTMNTFKKSHYLNLPVKDAYPFHDHEALKNDNEIIVTDAMVRTYETLLGYLNCRIDNVKDDYKSFGWTERTFNIIMFELDEKFRTDIVEDVNFSKMGLVEVKISVIE